MSEERYGRNYRTYVGLSTPWDEAASNCFALMTRAMGLREKHYLLDVGCGSLRIGRLFLMYLRPGRYYGIEPNDWLLLEAIRNEVSQGLIELKRPEFSLRDDLQLSVFDRRFDYILAQSIWSHAAPQQVQRCMYEGRKALKAGGRMVATFFEREEDYTGGEWVYPTAIGYTWDTLATWAEAASLNMKRIEWPHPDGQTWTLLRRK